VIDINSILAELSVLRPIYHSEADFQHALAWQIQKEYSNCVIRLERPFKGTSNAIHLDIHIRLEDVNIFLELKYKTRCVETTYQGEDYNLKSHSAQDTGRYDFIKDIWRIEELTQSTNNSMGYAIFLTNDSSYWNSSTQEQLIDANFRIAEGRQLKGILEWDNKASQGTKKNRNAPIELKGVYTIEWKPYSMINAKFYKEFRYTFVNIPSN
jgi:hypothetical protein